MVDPEAVDRSLAVARAALVAPDAARARVRAKLVAGGTFGGRSAGIKSGGVTYLTTALLVGAGFFAGYWLGVQRGTEPVAGIVAMQPQALTEPSPSLAAHEPAAIVEGNASSPGASSRAAAPEEDRVPGDAAREHARAPVHVQKTRTEARAVARRAPGVSSAARSQADSFAEELALLQRAERAIRAEQAPLALALLNELEQRYPRSTLIEERTAARILAECALGDPMARARADLFLRDRQTSVYSDRVRRSCGLAPAPAVSIDIDGSRSGGH